MPTSLKSELVGIFKELIVILFLKYDNVSSLVDLSPYLISNKIE